MEVYCISRLFKFGSLILIAVLAIPTESFAIGWFGADLKGFRCEGRAQSFGPWDFFAVDEPTDPDYTEGRWWEGKYVHAVPGLKALHELPFSQGAYDRAAAEFDYLLRAFPNHPEMLDAVIQLELKRQKTTIPIKPYRTPPECYLQRAQVYKPEQPHTYHLMGIYLHKLQRFEMAIEYYDRALTLDPDSAEVHYHVGLAYFETGQHDTAAACAKKAYGLGYPLPGLLRKLQRIDYSIESVPEDKTCRLSTLETSDNEDKLSSS